MTPAMKAPKRCDPTMEASQELSKSVVHMTASCVSSRGCTDANMLCSIFASNVWKCLHEQQRQYP